MPLTARFRHYAATLPPLLRHYAIMRRFRRLSARCRDAMLPLRYADTLPARYARALRGDMLMLPAADALPARCCLSCHLFSLPLLISSMRADAAR